MKKVTLQNRGKSFLKAFLCFFLLSFMLLIFGPSEIFFANVTEFTFLYQEFIGYMILFAVLSAALLSLCVTFLPGILYKIVVSLGLGIAAGGYLQVMFLNRKLDLLGQNPEGYTVAVGGKSIANLLIWLLIIGIILFLALVKDKIWGKVVQYLSLFMLVVQLIALVSLVMTADEGAYKRASGELHLSGTEQFQVSAKDNVIMIILDYMSSEYIEAALENYPDTLDAMNDFTCYNNADCVYFGTFPSIVHMLTGTEFEPSMPINDWCMSAWDNEMTNHFYDLLEEKDYKTYLYTPDYHMVCGLNDLELIGAKFDNVVDEAQEVEVDKPLLIRTLAKMSGYRMFPELCKPIFYTNMGEYANIVTVKENGVRTENYSYYRRLREKGLSKDDASNYFIVQHLTGAHEWTTDANGEEKENATKEETVKGCFVMLEEYLRQLRELGVYDDAAIIVTADHGGFQGFDSQPCFFMKKPGETHGEMVVTNAPISHCDLLPTILQTIGCSYEEYGTSIFDIAENESRERTFWVSMMNYDYPYIMCYTGDKEAAGNVYYGYQYTGNLDDLVKKMEQGPDIISQMLEGFY